MTCAPSALSLESSEDTSILDYIEATRNAAEIVAAIGFVIYHFWRLVIVWKILRRPYAWLVSFHGLSFLAALASIPKWSYDFACHVEPIFDGLHWPICEPASLPSGPLTAVLVIIYTFHNFAYFSLNTMYAYLGYLARKELAYAKNGVRGWSLQRRLMKVLTVLLIALGGLFFLRWDQSRFRLRPCLSDIAAAIAYLTLVLTSIGATVQVSILAAYLNYTQRVLPYLSTKLLLSGVVIGACSAICNALAAGWLAAGVLPVTVALQCLETLADFLSGLILAIAFRNDPTTKNRDREERPLMDTVWT